MTNAIFSQKCALNWLFMATVQCPPISDLWEQMWPLPLTLLLMLATHMNTTDVSPTWEVNNIDISNCAWLNTSYYFLLFQSLLLSYETFLYFKSQHEKNWIFKELKLYNGPKKALKYVWTFFDYFFDLYASMNAEFRLPKLPKLYKYSWVSHGRKRSLELCFKMSLYEVKFWAKCRDGMFLSLATGEAGTSQ